MIGSGREAGACAGAACALALLVLAGCGSSPARRAVAGGSTDPVSALVDGPRLVAELWAIRDADHDAARALAGLAERSALSEHEATRPWRENGLRLIEVPVEEIESLRDALPLREPIERRVWMGPAAWRSAITGPPLGQGQLLELDSGTLELDGGRLRILVRSWPEVAIAGSGPEARLDGRTRIDLAIQHAEVAVGDGRPASLYAQSGSIGDEGLVFERLLLTLAGDGRRAVAIVAAPPDENWQDLPPPRGSDDREVSSSAPPAGPAGPDLAEGGGDASADASPAPSEGPGGESGERGARESEAEEEVAGPPVARYPTLGEALLGPWGYPPGPPPTHVMVVLVPKPGPDQRLTAPASASASWAR